MNLTYGVITVVGVLVAISLALIMADPNETPESRELAIPENNIAQIEEDLTKLSVNPSLLTSTSNVGDSLVFEVEFMDDDGNIVDHVNYDVFATQNSNSILFVSIFDIRATMLAESVRIPACQPVRDVDSTPRSLRIIDNKETLICSPVESNIS